MEYWERVYHILSFKRNLGDFPGSPVVKAACFHYRGHEFNPWLGNKDPTCHKVQSE